MSYDYIPGAPFGFDGRGGFAPLRPEASFSNPGPGSHPLGSDPICIFDSSPKGPIGLYERVRQLEDRNARLNHTNQQLRDTLTTAQQWLQHYGCPWDPFRG